MRKKLKWKIFGSFSLLIGLLIAAGVVSIVEFRLLSNTFTGAIENNYKSILASKKMIESLEREDSGILLMIIGEQEEGYLTYKAADSTFQSEFIIAKNNITEQNEEDAIRIIEKSYQQYKQHFQLFLSNPTHSDKLQWYKTDIHPDFLTIKNEVGNLMDLNQNSLYSTSAKLKEKSTRAMMPGIVSIFAAILFSFILIFFISRFFVDPIHKLKTSIDAFKPKDYTVGANITHTVEFQQLEDSINGLILKLKKEKNEQSVS